jgi:hypothetical protein
MRTRSFGDVGSRRRTRLRPIRPVHGIFTTPPLEDSLLTRNEVTDASSNGAVSHNALRRAPITFVSREIHFETFQRWRTIASQIPAMTLGLS